MLYVNPWFNISSFFEQFLISKKCQLMKIFGKYIMEILLDSIDRYHPQYTRLFIGIGEIIVSCQESLFDIILHNNISIP